MNETIFGALAILFVILVLIWVGLPMGSCLLKYFRDGKNPRVGLELGLV